MEQWLRSPLLGSEPSQVKKEVVRLPQICFQVQGSAVGRQTLEFGRRLLQELGINGCSFVVLISLEEPYGTLVTHSPLNPSSLKSKFECLA